MSEYQCSDGDRLDIIVFKAYGSLEPMNIVLEANPHLLDHANLKAGDTVFLPSWQPPVKKEEAKTLW